MEMAFDKMTSKIKVDKKGVGKAVRLLVGAILVIGLAVFVIAEQNQSPQEELAQLEQELSDSGYSWLVDYFILQLNEKVYNNYKLLYSNQRLT